MCSRGITEGLELLWSWFLPASPLVPLAAAGCHCCPRALVRAEGQVDQPWLQWKIKPVCLFLKGVKLLLCSGWSCKRFTGSNAGSWQMQQQKEIQVWVLMLCTKAETQESKELWGGFAAALSSVNNLLWCLSPRDSRNAGNKIISCSNTFSAGTAWGAVSSHESSTLQSTHLPGTSSTWKPQNKKKRKAANQGWSMTFPPPHTGNKWFSSAGTKGTEVSFILLGKQ